jgi:prevent-host-death family protein
VETVSISQFKAKCLALLEQVRKTGETILVTRRGSPVAQVIPPPVPSGRASAGFGSMAGTARERGDIVKPVSDQDWEALR